MREVERRCAVEHHHVDHQFIGVQFFIHHENLDAPRAAVRPVPLCPAVRRFDDIDETGSRFNLKHAVNIAAVNVHACRGVERDVLEGEFSFVHGQIRRGCTTDEDGDGGVVVASIGVGRDVFVRIDGERHRCRADHHVGGHGPVDQNPLFCVRRHRRHGLSQHRAVGGHDFHDRRWSRQHAAVLCRQGETQNVPGQSVVADRSAQGGGVPVARALNDDGACLGDEVDANHAQILNDGGRSNDL